MTPDSDRTGRIVRVLTYGKEFEAIDQDIVRAVKEGHQVLVKVAVLSDGALPTIKDDTIAIADWAEALSQRHGLAWKRVGVDVLFHRSHVAPPPDVSSGPDFP